MVGFKEGFQRSSNSTDFNMELFPCVEDGLVERKMSDEEADTEPLRLLSLAK